jgi:hypothetical protein
VSTEVTLDVDQQRIAAHWAVKMAMMAEAFRDLSPDAFFFTQQQREVFRSSHALPFGTAVWLARYTGAQYSFIGANDASFTERIAGRAPDVYVSTFAAGRLAFQVMAVRLGPEHADATGINILGERRTMGRCDPAYPRARVGLRSLAATIGVVR